MEMWMHTYVITLISRSQYSHVLIESYLKYLEYNTIGQVLNKLHIFQGTIAQRKNRVLYLRYVLRVQQ